MSRIVDTLKRLQQVRQQQAQESTYKASLEDPIGTSLKPQNVFLEGENVASRFPMENVIKGLGLMGIVAMIFMSSMAIRGTGVNQEDIRVLEQSLKSQKTDIIRLNGIVSKHKSDVGNQIKILFKSLEKNTEETKTKLNSLAFTESDHYVKLKESIATDKRQIESLSKQIKILEKKIEEMATSLAAIQ